MHACMHVCMYVGTGELSYKSVSRDIGAAGRLIYSDKRLVYLIPYQVMCTIFSGIETDTYIHACKRT